MTWTPTDKLLPPYGVPVLASYIDDTGKRQTVRAHYIGRATVETHGGMEEIHDEYIEDLDQYFLIEGWYELISNWDDYTSIAITEHSVTHWETLPADPEQCTGNP